MPTSKLFLPLEEATNRSYETVTRLHQSAAEVRAQVAHSKVLLANTQATIAFLSRRLFVFGRSDGRSDAE